MSSPVTIQVLRSTAELATLAPQWIELWQADPRAMPFQRPEWLLPWWHQFGQPDLRVVTLWREERMHGLIPLYIYKEPQSGERQLLLLGAGTSDYLDGVFAPLFPAEHARAALELLAQENDWDVGHLTQLLPHSPLYGALQQLGAPTATPYSGESCSRCPALPIAELPAKIRADVRYYRNAASGRGRLALAVADRNSCGEVFEALVGLHTERWQQAGESGVLADPAVLRWHREAVPALEASGLLRLYALQAGEEVLGVLYSLVDPPSRANRTQYFYLMGFDSELSRLRPGTLLTAMAMEHAANEGVVTIDMLRGDEAYKKFWHVERVPTYGFAVQRSYISARP